MFLELPSHWSFLRCLRILVEEAVVMRDVRRVESQFIDDVDRETGACIDNLGFLGRRGNHMRHVLNHFG